MTNVSRGRDNQRMKSDHLIEFNMRNREKCGGEASTRPFCKK